MKASTQPLGQLGEDIASKFLQRKGFTIVAKNYRKKWGELDIIAQKEGVLHFVEVKTISHSTRIENVTHETDFHRPEDNVHPAKLKRMQRAIETYIAEKDFEGEWVVDVVAIELNLTDKVGKCRFLSNVL